MNVILNHSAGHGRPLTLEYLSRFVLRSRASGSIASILLQKLSTASDPSDPTQLPVQFCLEVIRLWDTCIIERCVSSPHLLSWDESLTGSVTASSYRRSRVARFVYSAATDGSACAIYCPNLTSGGDGGLLPSSYTPI